MSEKQSFWKYKFNDWSRDFTSLANPLILIFVPFIFLFRNNKEYFYVLLFTLLINEILGSAIKIIFPKTRPNGQKYSTLIEKIDAGSFPSLHSSRITIVYLILFSATTFIAFKILFIAIIPIVMLSRINLKKHFLTDILGGFVIGVVLWWLSSYFLNYPINIIG